MLVLGEAGSDLRDHVDPLIRYRLPTGLTPVSGPDGHPQIAIARGQGSGLLQVRLALDWPSLALNERRVPFSKGRFRLKMQTPSSQEAGDWRPTTLTGDGIVDRSVSLTAAEAAIARRLGQSGGELVDVEVELALSGFGPMYPWLVQADGELLTRTLAALGGSATVQWEVIEASFLGLGKELFQWHPLEPGAIPPPLDGALRAIAHLARPSLFESAEGGWRIRSATPALLSLNLKVPWLTTRDVGLDWRLSAFIAAQPDPSRYLLDLTIPAPLQGASLFIANDVPLASGGIQRLEVEVKTGGPTGRVNHVFLPGEPSAVTIPFVRQTFEDLDLAWNAKLLVMTSRGPAMVETPDVRTDLAIALTLENVGLVALHFRVAAEVFAHVVSIEIIVGARVLVLTAQKPDDWVVGHTTPATCTVSATPPGGTKTLLGAIPLQQALLIDAGLLRVGELTPILFRAPASLATLAAYLAIQVEGGSWRTLDAGGEISWPFRQTSCLEVPQVRYKTRHVPRLATGGTGVITESGFKTGLGSAVEVVF